MADYHILRADWQGNAFRVAMHFPVPNTTNEAGVNYRTAVAQAQGGAVVSIVPDILPAEQGQLDTGELIERVYWFRTDPSETPAQKQAQLDVMWSTKRSAEQAALARILSYWGYARTIP